MRNKKDCKKYGLAITNYVLGEKINVTPGELFSHLLVCKKCREELFDWQNNIAVLGAEEYHNRPEVKKETESLIRKLKKELTSQPRPGKKPINTKLEITSAAEKIYNCVKTNGKIALPVIRQKTGLIDYPFYEAVGSLVIKEKLILIKDKNNRPTHLSPRA